MAALRLIRPRIVLLAKPEIGEISPGSRAAKSAPAPPSESRVGPADGPGQIGLRPDRPREFWLDRCERSRAEDLYTELGDANLLNGQGARHFSAMVAAGQFLMESVDLRSYAAQFGLAWPREETLRKVAWTLFEHGALEQKWPGVRELADYAGVCYNSVTKYRQRAMAVGLPLLPGLDDDFPFAWMPVRRECVWTVLRAGLFASWPTLIERVDALCEEIDDPEECERFAYVGQAVVSLRLFGKGEGRPFVRAELKAERAALTISDRVLDKIIASVQKALDAK